MVDRKAEAAVKAGLIPIICIGETIQEREAGNTFDVIREQLEGSLKNYRDKGKMPSSTILAYEPVWAIGTGKTATPEQAEEVHQLVRGIIRSHFGDEVAQRTTIQYGGSVKPDNVDQLMSSENIDGALVGGASLKADSFLKLINFRSKATALTFWTAVPLPLITLPPPKSRVRTSQTPSKKLLA